MMRWRLKWKPMEAMKPEKTLSALGLCAKARRLVCGTPMICEALRAKNKPFLVILASDNSENTEKKLTDKCRFYGVPLAHVAADGERLAAAVGKQSRVAAVAVTDENLCRLVENTLKEQI